LGLIITVAFWGCTLDRSGGISDPGAGNGGSGTGVGGIMTGPSSGGAGTGGSPSGTGGEGANGGMGGEAGGPPVCGMGLVCLPDPGMGQLVAAKSSGVCPTGWDKADVVFDGTDPGCNNQCLCGAANGGCQGGTITRYSDNACASFLDGPTPYAFNVCVNVDATNDAQAQSYVATLPVLQAGACAASGADTPALTQTTLCTLTAMPSMGCDAGELCVPDPAATRRCMTLDGDASCAAPFTQKSVFYATANDGRSCDCSCGLEQNGTCGDATVSIYNANNCTGFLASALASVACLMDADPAHDSYRVTGGAYQPGTCPATSTESGSVGFGGPRTLCCEPMP
jgi:hypothetical protein